VYTLAAGNQLLRPFVAIKTKTAYSYVGVAALKPQQKLERFRQLM
jgi:hypothetical protein